jgi:uncharacterized paraquat-inducible protein A
MRPFIILSIYILVPFFISLLYKKLKLKDLVILTHIVCGIIILIYPYFLLKIDAALNPSTLDQVDDASLPLFIFNTVLMIPITQGLLFVFNNYYKNYSFQIHFGTMRTHLTILQEIDIILVQNGLETERKELENEILGGSTGSEICLRCGSRLLIQQKENKKIADTIGPLIKEFISYCRANGLEIKI